MPQLMPLNWATSVVLIFVIFISISMIYSEKDKNLGEMKFLGFKSSSMSSWWW